MATSRAEPVADYLAPAGFLGYTEEQMGALPYQPVLGFIIPAFFCFLAACSGSSTSGDGNEGDTADHTEHADDSLEDEGLDIAETDTDDLPPILDSDNDTISDAHEGENHA